MTNTLIRIVFLGALISTGARAEELTGSLLGDAQVIEALEKNGSDLSKPHLVDFFFDFADPAGAKAICKQLEAEGYEPHLEQNDESGIFTCRAVKRTIPTIKTMNSLTHRFEALAQKHGGEYDGWGAPVEE